MKKEDRVDDQPNDHSLQTTRNFEKVCPKCESISVSTRTRKKPKYKCNHCDFEFDDPKVLINYKMFNHKRNYGRNYSFFDE